MKTEDRLKKLEAANRLYRVLLVVALSLMMIVVFVSANEQERDVGDTLTTPVLIQSPSGIVLRIDDAGVIEFWTRGRVAAKLNGTAVNNYEDMLPEQASILRKVQTTLKQHDKTLSDHKKTLKVLERHVAIDKRIR